MIRQKQSFLSEMLLRHQIEVYELKNTIVQMVMNLKKDLSYIVPAESATIQFDQEPFLKKH